MKVWMLIGAWMLLLLALAATQALDTHLLIQESRMAMNLDHEVVTEEGLLKYLVNQYGLLPEEAKQVVERHRAILQKGVALQSFTYYVGDDMMEAEATLADEEGG